MKMSNIGRKVC